MSDEGKSWRSSRANSSSSGKVLVSPSTMAAGLAIAAKRPEAPQNTSCRTAVVERSRLASPCRPPSLPLVDLQHLDAQQGRVDDLVTLGEGIHVWARDRGLAENAVDRGAGV